MTDALQIDYTKGCFVCDHVYTDAGDAATHNCSEREPSRVYSEQLLGPDAVLPVHLPATEDDLT